MKVSLSSGENWCFLCMGKLFAIWMFCNFPCCAYFNHSFQRFAAPFQCATMKSSQLGHWAYSGSICHVKWTVPFPTMKLISKQAMAIECHFPWWTVCLFRLTFCNNKETRSLHCCNFDYVLIQKLMLMFWSGIIWLDMQVTEEGMQDPIYSVFFCGQKDQSVTWIKCVDQVPPLSAVVFLPDDRHLMRFPTLCKSCLVSLYAVFTQFLILSAALFSPFICFWYFQKPLLHTITSISYVLRSVIERG